MVRHKTFQKMILKIVCIPNFTPESVYKSKNDFLRIFRAINKQYRVFINKLLLEMKVMLFYSSRIFFSRFLI